jgi:hypothetical protein
MSLCRSKTRRNQMAGLSIQYARGTEMICWDMDMERRWMNICARTWMLQANTWVASYTAAVLLGMANCSKLKTLSPGQLKSPQADLQGVDRSMEDISSSPPSTTCGCGDHRRELVGATPARGACRCGTRRRC